VEVLETVVHEEPVQEVLIDEDGIIIIIHGRKIPVHDIHGIIYCCDRRDHIIRASCTVCG